MITIHTLYPIFLFISCYYKLNSFAFFLLMIFLSYSFILFTGSLLIKDINIKPLVDRLKEKIARGETIKTKPTFIFICFSYFIITVISILFDYFPIISLASSLFGIIGFGVYFSKLENFIKKRSNVYKMES